MKAVYAFVNARIDLKRFDVCGQAVIEISSESRTLCLVKIGTKLQITFGFR